MRFCAALRTLRTSSSHWDQARKRICGVGLRRAEHCSQLHPLAAEWLYPVVYSSVIHEFVYSNAITEYTYSWLEADLRRVQWRE